MNPFEFIMDFMRKAGKTPQIKLSKENTINLKRIIKKTLRTLTQEANTVIAHWARANNK